MQENRKYKNTKEQLKVKLDNLKQLILILDSNMKKYEKIIELCKIYSTPEKFRRTYQLIYNKGQEDPMFKEYIGRFIDIYNFYLACQSNELLDNAKYILSIEGYLEDYEIAESIIIDYIMCEDSYRFSEFLINHGINDKIFERYTKIIATINIKLYDKFLERFEENKRLRFISNRETIKELAKEIKEEEIEVLEFLRRIPFITSRTFVNKLMEFMKRNNSIEEYNAIMSYMAKNRLFDKNLTKPLAIEELYKERTIINGREITKEDNDIILEYMKENKYPMIRKSYVLVRKKYLNDDISLTEKEKIKVKENSLD